ncbi:Oligopeptide-binding protein OppA [Chlamydia avium]|uniref:Bacterial extracellular solute-binding s, 5 Middle family protein n=2 Tax=Chlamydia avium TaxID=1457141 RepID=W8JFC7_9CHLA|nr:ABC transporter substrate-binding protein [Chlamydia avium]AHK63246.1 Bacterial extracellular solute-binding s, 5 Middle family protein [Chlamydia avium 10DC88]EPP36666.1 bacterial extracellular solute-binding s, 5 Middle family protein [Chlamydia psittaci 10_743_SC13]EPP38094.1 bacterial extracellular solute-binding s, 5 Middle family protein [Chlamydia avium]VVT42848.1 Oligopeptide-binding protein OppA [Chlamydia avium]
MKVIIFLRSVIVLFFSFLMGGCCSKSFSNKPALTIAIYDDPLSLSPEQAKRALDLSISKLIFEGLTRENTNTPTCVELALASHYTVSTDETQYTFFLKPNTCWNDGTEITAHDIVKAWEYAKKFSPHRKLFDGIRFSSCSPSTITLTLDAPNPNILGILSSPVFSVFNPDNLNVFSGPFHLITHIPNHCLILGKNPHYYDKNKVAVNSIHLLVVPDLYTAALLLQRGEIQWLGQPWHQGLPKELKESSHYLYTRYPVEGIFWLTINTQDPFLSNIDNRRRLASAINREEIIQYALQNNQEPAYGLKRDIQLEIPYLKRKTTMLPQKLTLIYPANILRCQHIAEILKEQLKREDIDIIPEGLEYHAFLNKRQNRDFSLATGTGVALYPNAPVILESEPEKLIKNLEIFPIYHMSYDYLTTVHIKNILHNSSGAVDLKYACCS